MRKPPLPLYVAEGVGFHGVLYSVLPHVAARHDQRRGWRRNRPGAMNRIGLLLVAAGATFIGCAAVGHHHAAPDDARFSATPVHLATTGAYAVSRNPLYVGGMTIWFGWATFLGSRRAAVVGLAWLAGLAAVGVPFEERLLTRKFGDAYIDYTHRVRRWL